MYVEPTEYSKLVFRSSLDSNDVLDCTSEYYLLSQQIRRNSLQCCDGIRVLLLLYQSPGWSYTVSFNDVLYTHGNTKFWYSFFVCTNFGF